MSSATPAELATEAWNRLPAEWPGDALSLIRQQLDARRHKVVVLDDDPTGTQTVHDIYVLTDWDRATLCAELKTAAPAFYLLTNSRSLPLAEAQALNVTIARNLQWAARETGSSFVVVSRGDSTLRGHFPGEVDALIEGLGRRPDGVLLIPFFAPGGRYTFGDIHYVLEGDCLIPAARTPYARDPVFGYQNSDLRRWVEEKTAGRIGWHEVESISIEDIRCGGPQKVAAQLRRLAQGAVAIVNAVSAADLEVFTAGLLEAEAGGKRFLYRTAASFVPVRAGLNSRPLLTAGELSLAGGAGSLMIAGSFVPRTTEQVEAVLAAGGAAGLELHIDNVLDGDCEREVGRVAAAADRALATGRDVVIFSTRRPLEARGADFVAAGRRISGALVDTVRRLTVRPRCLIAKGGITASDLATGALGVKRALVLGQILPGVPVWKLGPETRYPGLSYIIFPGNVGSADALLRVARLLAAASPEDPNRVLSS